MASPRYYRRVMKRETIPGINFGACPEQGLGELFTQADEREAEEILAKPDEERRKIIDERVAVVLNKIAQRSNEHMV